MLLEFAGFPVKKVDVNVLKDFKVIPGGQSIGVKFNTLGVLVVGHHRLPIREKYLQVKWQGLKLEISLLKLTAKKLKKCQMLLLLFKKQVKAINL